MENKNIKQITEDIRTILLLVLNIKEPLNTFSCVYIQNQTNFSKNYVEHMINYMLRDNLLEGKNSSCPKLSSKGLYLAQDISNDTIWNQAMNICDSIGVYSIQTITYAIEKIIQKEIDKAIKK